MMYVLKAFKSLTGFCTGQQETQPWERMLRAIYFHLFLAAIS